MQINSIETNVPAHFRSQPTRPLVIGKAGGLFIKLCKRFAGLGEDTGITSQQLLAAFENLRPHLNDDAKKAASDILANLPSTPRALAVQLAMEPVEIGGAMLRLSPVLGQLDLLRIAKTCGPEHARCVAHRDDCGHALSRQIGKSTTHNVIVQDFAPSLRVSNNAFLPKVGTQTGQRLSA